MYLPYPLRRLRLRAVSRRAHLRALYLICLSYPLRRLYLRAVSRRAHLRASYLLHQPYSVYRQEAWLRRSTEACWVLRGHQRKGFR
jgi:hypothetical protein